MTTFERRRVPRQGVHIADPDVASGVPVPGHRDQPGRGIDTRAASAAQASQLDREPGPARHVEQPVSGIDAEPMVQSDVLPAVARLAERGEIHRLTAPALIHHRPLRNTRTRPRHCCSLSSPGPPFSLVSPVYGASGCPVLDIHGTAERCQPLTRNAQVAALTGGDLHVGPSVVVPVTGQPALWRCARRRGPRRRAAPSGNPVGCRLPPVPPASWWPGRPLWLSRSPSAGRPGSG